jgi:hypothetical protein
MIHRLLPRLGSHSGQNPLSHTVTLTDIAHVLEPTYIHDWTVYQLVLKIFRRIARQPAMSYATQEFLERRARIQLGVVEMIGAQLVDIFTRTRRTSQEGESEAKPRRKRRASAEASHLSPNMPIERFPVAEVCSEPVRSEPVRELCLAEAVTSKELDEWWRFAAMIGVIALALVSGLFYL